MKALIISIFALISLTPFAAFPNSKIIDGIDTFGSKRISPTKITEKYGKSIDHWVIASKNSLSEYASLKKEIEDSIKDEYHFAYVDLALITYFQPSGNYVTVDVVEPHEASERMAFLPNPQLQLEDPDGLIALWDKYHQVGRTLQAEGQFENPKSCPVWHCSFGFESPKLEPFLETFNQLVPKNQEKLIQILQQDARPQFRGNAAFLLAHTKNGNDLVKHALGSTRDPSLLVRNNLVRVLSEIARRHPEIEISLEPILQVLKFPNTTDRNKAGYTLVYLSQIERNKPVIIHAAGFTLFEMLKLLQPNNHDPAYQVLKNISGQHFDRRDYASWERWLLSQKK